MYRSLMWYPIFILHYSFSHYFLSNPALNQACCSFLQSLCLNLHVSLEKMNSAQDGKSDSDLGLGMISLNLQYIVYVSEYMHHWMGCRILILVYADYFKMLVFKMVLLAHSVWVYLSTSGWTVWEHNKSWERCLCPLLSCGVPWNSRTMEEKLPFFANIFGEGKYKQEIGFWGNSMLFVCLLPYFFGMSWLFFSLLAQKIAELLKRNLPELNVSVLESLSLLSETPDSFCLDGRLRNHQYSLLLLFYFAFSQEDRWLNWY